jgi:cell division protein ZapA
MATVDIDIAGRSYPVACRDGEEAHLRALAALVDHKAREAATALGSMGETRQFLFTSLLLADELKEHMPAAGRPTSRSPTLPSPMRWSALPSRWKSSPSGLRAGAETPT